MNARERLDDVDDAFIESARGATGRDGTLIDSMP